MLMILLRTMGGERKVAGSRQETGACPAFCAACLGTRQCTAGPPALPSLPNDTVCHNHTQARINPNCFKCSEKCQFAPDPVFWGFADVTLVNEDTKSTYWWSQELQCGNEIYNQWIGIQEPQTKYYSLLQPVLVEAFKKNGVRRTTVRFGAGKSERRKRWKRRLWLSNRPFGNRSVIM